MRTRSRSHLFLLMGALALAGACGSSSAPTDAASFGGAVAAGGSRNNGGAIGTGGAPTLGTGGSVASSGGAQASGGVTGSGGKATGGASGTGGIGGSSGIDASIDVARDVSPPIDSIVVDAPGDVALPDAPTSVDSLAVDTRPVASLNACFASLPAPVGRQIVVDKTSGDGTVHVRMALDDLGVGGLAAMWTLIRFGIEIDGVVTCVTDKASLSYSARRHNCNDSASAKADVFRYQIDDAAASMSGLRVFNGSVETRTVGLTRTACSSANGQVERCPANGPC